MAKCGVTPGAPHTHTHFAGGLLDWSRGSPCLSDPGSGEPGAPLRPCKREKEEQLERQSWVG